MKHTHGLGARRAVGYLLSSAMLALVYPAANSRADVIRLEPAEAQLRYDISESSVDGGPIVRLSFGRYQFYLRCYLNGAQDSLGLFIPVDDQNIPDEIRARLTAGNARDLGNLIITDGIRSVAGDIQRSTMENTGVYFHINTEINNASLNILNRIVEDSFYSHFIAWHVDGQIIWLPIFFERNIENMVDLHNTGIDDYRLIIRQCAGSGILGG